MIIETAVPPEEIERIANGLNLEIKVLEKSKRRIPLWKIEIKGSKEDLEVFLERLKRARAGA
ncbi:TIGR04140 family protein [Pyrococcus abyssi]|uniref:TIGR04140 family protein n=1 Tax=Pyrococcus abyssi (strain GE5 / Orsay) TaxID=272844 RepID=G8ZGJ9_PYRAB|nr:TIGR04140 family protein [Pyrococcus abyssi]CCE69878.1 TPA: hypothetical protein PAB0328.2n [Pyrococcus abyssi GE5]